MYIGHLDVNDVHLGINDVHLINIVQSPELLLPHHSGHTSPRRVFLCLNN